MATALKLQLLMDIDDKLGGKLNEVKKQLDKVTGEIKQKGEDLGAAVVDPVKEQLANGAELPRVIYGALSGTSALATDWLKTAQEKQASEAMEGLTDITYLDVKPTKFMDALSRVIKISDFYTDTYDNLVKMEDIVKKSASGDMNILVGLDQFFNTFWGGIIGREQEAEELTNKVKGFFDETKAKGNEFLEKTKKELGEVQTKLGETKEKATNLYKELEGKWSPVQEGIDKFGSAFKDITGKTVGEAIIRDAEKLQAANDKLTKLSAFGEASKLVANESFNVADKFVTNYSSGIDSGKTSLNDALSKILHLDVKGAKESALSGVKDLSGFNAAKGAFDEAKELQEKFKSKYNEVMGKTEDTEAADGTAAEAGVDAEGTGTPSTEAASPLAGTAQAINENSESKNLTINIDSFIKEFSPTQQEFNDMSADELESFLTDMFLRVARSAETAI